MTAEQRTDEVLFMEMVKPNLDMGKSIEEIAKATGIEETKVRELVERFTTPYCQRDGPTLFRDVMNWFGSMFHFDDPKEATLVALMIFQTRVYTLLPCVFYLFIMGKAGSGKTSLLNAMAMLGSGILLGNISPPAMARELGRGRNLRGNVESEHTTRSPRYHMACCDEYDSLGDKDRHAAMDGLLRHGYKRDGPPYIRWDMKGNVAERFDMYMPKAAAVTSSIEPALSSRGFKIGATPYKGPNGFDVLINNRYPAGVETLIERLDEWGKDVCAYYDPARIEALERSPEHAKRVEQVTGALGANRENELALTATTVATMIGIDITAELKHGVETPFTAGEEYEDEIEELSEALLRVAGEPNPIDAATTVTIKQSAVKKAINDERERNHRKPLGDKRFSAIYRAAGIKTHWVRNRSGRNYWVVPVTYLRTLKGLANLPNMANVSEELGQQSPDVDQVGRVRQLHEDAESGVAYDALVAKYGLEVVEREKIPKLGGRAQ